MTLIWDRTIQTQVTSIDMKRAYTAQDRRASKALDSDLTWATKSEGGAALTARPLILSMVGAKATYPQLTRAT